MELNSLNGLGAVTDPSDRPVIEVCVGNLQIGGQPFRSDRVSVILRGDENPSTPHIKDGLVCPTVTELQLECRGAEGQ